MDPDQELEIYACRVGKSSFQETFVFHDGRKDTPLTIAWSFYVVRQGREIALIDAAFYNPDIVPRDWNMLYEKTPTELLSHLKIIPSAVDRIIITHSHGDHIDGILHFPHAKTIISRSACDYYINQENSNARIKAILSDPNRTLQVDEREKLTGGFEFEVVGGHAPGSAVVHLHHRNVHYVFVGDECYLCANRNERRPLGVTYNWKANADFLARIADPCIVVLACHDPLIYETYTKAMPKIENIVRILTPR